MLEQNLYLNNVALNVVVNSVVKIAYFFVCLIIYLFQKRILEPGREGGWNDDPLSLLKVH